MTWTICEGCACDCTYLLQQGPGAGPARGEWGVGIHHEQRNGLHRHAHLLLRRIELAARLRNQWEGQEVGVEGGLLA